MKNLKKTPTQPNPHNLCTSCSQPDVFCSTGGSCQARSHPMLHFCFQQDPCKRADARKAAPQSLPRRARDGRTRRTDTADLPSSGYPATPAADRQLQATRDQTVKRYQAVSPPTGACLSSSAALRPWPTASKPSRSRETSPSATQTAGSHSAASESKPGEEQAAGRPYCGLPVGL